MYKILQIDGGGPRGVIPAMICAEIERLTGRHIWQDFDLIIGTSTGSIIGGCLAAGVPAQKIVDLYKNKVPTLFKPRSKLIPANWFREKYDRVPFVEEIRNQVGDTKLEKLYTRFMATAWGRSAGRTHFIKSFDPQDFDRSLVDVISWSALSAAYYFGKINVPDYGWTHMTPSGSRREYQGESFQDGGQGLLNCALIETLVEVLALDLDEQGAALLSLGCGDVDGYTPYLTVSKQGIVRQVIDFFSDAREESSIQQVLAADYVSSKRPTIDFYRFNVEITKPEAELDATKFLDKQIAAANALIQMRGVEAAVRGIVTKSPKIASPSGLLSASSRNSTVSEIITTR